MGSRGVVSAKVGSCYREKGNVYELSLKGLIKWKGPIVEFENVEVVMKRIFGVEMQISQIETQAGSAMWLMQTCPLCWECYYKATGKDSTQKRDFRLVKKISSNSRQSDEFRSSMSSQKKISLKGIFKNDPNSQTLKKIEKENLLTSTNEQGTVTSRKIKSQRAFSSFDQKRYKSKDIIQMNTERNNSDQIPVSLQKERPSTERQQAKFSDSKEARGRSGKAFESIGYMNEDDAMYMRTTHNMMNYARLKSGDKSKLELKK